MPTLNTISVEDDGRYATNIVLVIELSDNSFHQCIFKKGDSPEKVALMLKVLADGILHDKSLKP